MKAAEKFPWLLDWIGLRPDPTAATDGTKTKPKEKATQHQYSPIAA
jgi:hypothetical protein